uniref:Uncharacterized protein n=1 Tax=Arundo donax TaxID=35708 RepID=A0A0A8YHA5_ARUDO
MLHYHANYLKNKVISVHFHSK